MDTIDRFEVPSPFDTGAANCYLCAGDHLTLLDPGPSTDAAYETLTTQLGRRGYAIADVDRLMVTHEHADHAGIVGRIQEESGARTLAHRSSVDRLSDPSGFFSREKAVFQPFLSSMGVPEEKLDGLLELAESYLELLDPATIDEPLSDGDTIHASTGIDVLHTPGHSPGSVCYLTSDSVFVGDTVLDGVTPNPVMTLDENGQRTRGLPTYLSSLRKLRDVDKSVAYGGHYDPIEDLQGRITDILDHHQIRKDRMVSLLDEMGPVTAYELMEEMFPELPLSKVFTGMSEVVGHLDVLEDADQVEIDEGECVRRYSLR